MAVTAHASGTQAATVGTEHFLTSPGVAGTYTLHVNTENMVDGDALELRAYQKILSGSTARVAYYKKFRGVQTGDEIKISVPVSNDLTTSEALRFSLKQTQGAAGRNFDWKVLKYA